MRKLFLLTVLLVSSTSIFAQWGRPVDYAAGPGLKDAYKDYFTIGVAVNQTNVTDPAQIEIIKKQFNSVTAENDWKPGEIHPKEGVWNFEKADKIANFCRENGIKMRGHCLCWHSQFADWMFTDKKGKPVKKEVFYERLRDHIHTVVNRYKDVVYAWDVVNEAIADDNMMFRPGATPSPYRQSKHFQLCGDEFIAKAFEFAREADPTGVLIDNDYDVHALAKSQNATVVTADGTKLTGTVSEIRETRPTEERFAWLTSALLGSIPEVPVYTVGTEVEDPEGLLKEGDMVTVDIVTDTAENALSIPSSSVFMDGPQPYVWIFHPFTKKLSRQDISVGLVTEEKTEVLRGLKKGSKVLSGSSVPTAELYDGVRVKTK